jgi:hypothetical protein
MFPQINYTLMHVKKPGARAPGKLFLVEVLESELGSELAGKGPR